MIFPSFIAAYKNQTFLVFARIALNGFGRFGRIKEFTADVFFGRGGMVFL